MNVIPTVIRITSVQANPISGLRIRIKICGTNRSLTQTNTNVMKYYAFNKTAVPENRWLSKLLLVMRITTFLLLLSLMQVSAAGFAQKITIAKKNVSLKDVFKEITRQTGYEVFYFSNKMNDSKKVNVDYNEVDLKVVLKDLINEDQFSYTIDENTIIIKARQASLPDKIKTTIVSLLQQDSVTYRGAVYDELGRPMPGVTVRLKGAAKATRTEEQGTFVIYGPANKAVLVFSFIGYKDKEMRVSRSNAAAVLRVGMEVAVADLSQVDIVSTGYSEIPKERATGSFEVITKEKLMESPSPSLVDRLEGLVPSMNFANTARTNAKLATDKYGKGNSLNGVTIRGKNTLVNEMNTVTLGYAFASLNLSGQPLVVVDGMPVNYFIDQINPNDVESITLLKDAAAASIWGSRAANGVIVVQTKKGKYNKPLNISFTSNVTVNKKLDLFYPKWMSTSDFIDIQILQYNRRFPMPSTGLPNITANSTSGIINVSPVAEIMDAVRKGLLSPTAGEAQINALRNNDIRNDYNKYIMKDAVNQNYALNFSGGSEKISYYASGNYDHSLDNYVGFGSKRYTGSIGITFRPLQGLDISPSVRYINTLNEGKSAALSPLNFSGQNVIYSRLADDNGNPVARARTYRPRFISLLKAAYGDNILDMTYIPLEDVKKGHDNSTNQNIVFGVNIAYRPKSIVSFTMNYTFTKENTINDILNAADSWIMREYINVFTDKTTFKRNVPLGGRLYLMKNDGAYHQGRAQVNADKKWGNDHELNALVAVDISQSYARQNQNYYYGYDEKTKEANGSINYAGAFSTLFPTSSVTISNSNIIQYAAQGFDDWKKRELSISANAAYTFKGKYTFTASTRRDASSEFGSGVNQWGSPYFHTGASWNISKEHFYKFALVPDLKFRASYGFNGNINPGADRVLLSGYGTALSGLPYAVFRTDVDNPLIRPEKTGMLNLGLDFGFSSRRVSGSLEYYDERTKDLISQGYVDPSTGFTRPNYNTGNLHTHGVELALNAVNIKGNKFSWSTDFGLSYNRVKVTKLYTPSLTAIGPAIVDNSPLVGYDLTPIFAYRWAGLDPVTGDPRSYLNGNVVSIGQGSAGNDKYLAIYNAPINTGRYFGSGVPLYSGNMGNRFSYKGFSLSANLMFHFGYYRRRPVQDVLAYSKLFGSGSSADNNIIQSAEYGRRWKQPGDEKITNVPSQIYTTTTGDNLRDQMYLYSEINVYRADHIRLQRINLSYNFNKGGKVFKNIQLYGYVNNLGILWRANKLGIDPEIRDYPSPRSYSIGLNTNF